MLKDLRILVGAEVTVVTTSLGVREDNPVNELLQAPLTIISSNSSTEVLRRDDCRSINAPKIWVFDSTLLENNLTSFPVVLNNISPFPIHIVVWMDSLGREQSDHL